MEIKKNSLIRLISFYTNKLKELELDSNKVEEKELVFDTLRLLLELKEYRLKEHLQNIKDERLNKLRKK